MIEIIKKIEDCIMTENIVINNDLEASYLYAQAIKYLCMLSESEDKRGLEVKGIKIDNINSMKSKLMDLYTKYKYKLSTNSEHLVNKVVNALLVYTPEKRVNRELRINIKLAYLCGISNKNSILIKIKNNNEKANKNKKDEVI